MDNKLKSLVKEIKYRRSWNTLQVAKSIGYTREHLTTEMNKGDNPDLIKLLEAKHSEILQDVKQIVSHEIPKEYLPLTEQGLTMQALVNLTESNRLLAESNRLLATSHAELILMVKGQGNLTGDAGQQTLAETVGTVLGMRALLVEIAAAVGKKPQADVHKDLDSKVKAAMQTYAHKGNVAVDGN